MYNTSHNLHTHAIMDEILRRLHDCSHVHTRTHTYILHTYCVYVHNRKNTDEHSEANLYAK